MALLVFRYGSLWLMIGYHFGWNATASGIFGLELSGLDDLLLTDDGPAHPLFTCEIRNEKKPDV
jgi:hypothetical protein